MIEIASVKYEQVSHLLQNYEIEKLFHLNDSSKLFEADFNVYIPEGFTNINIALQEYNHDFVYETILDPDSCQNQVFSKVAQKVHKFLNSGGCVFADASYIGEISLFDKSAPIKEYETRFQKITILGNPEKQFFKFDKSFSISTIKFLIDYLVSPFYGLIILKQLEGFDFEQPENVTVFLSIFDGRSFLKMNIVM